MKIKKEIEEEISINYPLFFTYRYGLQQEAYALLSDEITIFVSASGSFFKHRTQFQIDKLNNPAYHEITKEQFLEIQEKALEKINQLKLT